MAGENRRCLWCHGAEGELTELNLKGDAWQEEPSLIHPGHEERLRAFMDEAQRRSRLFIILIVALVFLMMNSTLVAIAVAQWIGTMIMGASLLGMAATIMVMPFATPQTARALGIRRSITVARACGVGIGVFGLILVVISLC